MTAEFADVNGIRVAYRSWGSASAKPPIVLLHAALHASSVWGVVGPKLAADRLVLAPDLRGHGATTRPDPRDPAAYAPAAVAADVTALLEALDLQHPVLIGHSWGAAVALDVVAALPPTGAISGETPGASARERFRRRGAVVLVEPPLRLGDGRAVAALDAALPLLALERPRLVRVLTGLLTEPGPGVAEGLADALLGADPVVARAAVLAAASAGDLVDRLPPPVPWLLLRADPATSLLSDADLTRLPEADVVTIPGAGPSIPHDVPTRFVAAVRDFLE